MKPRQILVSLAIALSASATVNILAGPVTFKLLADVNYPGFPVTEVSKINDAGYAAGSVNDLSGHLFGFIRYPDGRLSNLITDPDGDLHLTGVYGINNLGDLSGFYDGGGLPQDGFLLLDRTFVTVDFPGALYSDVFDVNDAGNFCGDYIDKFGKNLAFVNIDGTYISFEIPGAFLTGAYGINNLNQCVGYFSYDFGVPQAFFRDADGTLTYPIEIPGEASGTLLGINDKGWMVGEVSTFGQSAGVIFFSSTKFATYHYPGATFTTFSGINNQGQICGNYKQGLVDEHSFILHVGEGAAK